MDEILNQWRGEGLSLEKLASLHLISDDAVTGIDPNTLKSLQKCFAVLEKLLERLESCVNEIDSVIGIDSLAVERIDRIERLVTDADQQFRAYCRSQSWPR